MRSALPLIAGNPGNIGCHDTVDGGLDLSDAERRDVHAILAGVVAGLTRRATTAAGIRRKLDAVIAELIDLTDAINGDSEMEEGGDDERPDYPD